MATRRRRNATPLAQRPYAGTDRRLQGLTVGQARAFLSQAGGSTRGATAGQSGG